MRHFLGLGRGGRILVGLAVGGVLFGIATAVQAAIPDSSGVIHGCFGKPGTPQKGELRVRDTGELCRSYENPLNWNAAGVTGAKGLTGPTGPTGPSDGWDGGTGGTVPTGGAFATFPGVTGVTPGSYLISGHVVWARLAAGSADLQCFLTTSNAGSSSLGGQGIASTAGGGSAPLTGRMTVSAGTGGLGVECREVSGTVSVDVQTRVQAIRVGTLH